MERGSTVSCNLKKKNQSKTNGKRKALRRASGRRNRIIGRPSAENIRKSSLKGEKAAVRAIRLRASMRTTRFVAND